MIIKIGQWQTHPPFSTQQTTHPVASVQRMTQGLACAGVRANSASTPTTMASVAIPETNFFISVSSLFLKSAQWADTIIIHSFERAQKTITTLTGLGTLDVAGVAACPRNPSSTTSGPDESGSVLGMAATGTLVAGGSASLPRQRDHRRRARNACGSGTYGPGRGAPDATSPCP